MRQFMSSLCEHYGAKPKRDTLRGMLAALVRSPQCETDGAPHMRDAIAMSEQMIAGEKVNRDEAVVHLFYVNDFMNGSDEIELPRRGEPADWKW